VNVKAGIYEEFVSLSTKFWPFHEIPHILPIHMKTTTPKHESEPAFPCSAASFEASGLTKREWLAGLAMQAMLLKLEHTDSMETLYTASVGIADGLLAELAK